MTDTKILIDMAFAGEVPEKFLMEQLGKRTEEQIIQDLKENVDFEGLLNVRDALEDHIEQNPDSDNEKIEKSLEYVYKAIRERCSELLDAEKRVKELLNC